ncbi:hypothetical protein ACFDTO_27595 [Microbacteriaceae bacterium 4G12]
MIYEEFRYFIKAYMTLSIDKKEIPAVISQFVEHESIEQKEQMLHELHRIVENNDWEAVQKMVREYGKRECSVEELRGWILLFIHELQSKKA